MKLLRLAGEEIGEGGFFNLEGGEQIVVTRLVGEHQENLGVALLIHGFTKKGGTRKSHVMPRLSRQEARLLAFSILEAAD